MCRWASVTSWISSHSSPVGSGRFWRVFTISSFLRRSLFSSIRRRFATRFESSSTTARGKNRRCVRTKHLSSICELQILKSLCAHAASLTVHGHAHCNALLEAAELTLVAGNLVDDAAAIVLTGVGRVEVLLDGPTEETLQTGQ